MNIKTIRGLIYIFLLVSLLGFPECYPDDEDGYPNKLPYWETSPSDISVIAGERYDEMNGMAADDDIPNLKKSDPGFIRCLKKKSTCLLPVEVIGRGSGNVSCNVFFRASMAEECVVTVQVVDGDGGSISRDIKISVIQTVDISNCTPGPVAEGGAATCEIAANGGTPEIDPATDTCGGTVSGAAPWTYDFTSTEEQGPGGCAASVRLTENNEVKDSQIVRVDEINTIPTIALACPANVNEGSTGVCAITPADPDLPNADPADPGYIACSLNAATTCPGATITNCAQVDFTGDEVVGQGTCDIVVDIDDGFGATAQDTATITIDEVCAAPVITNLPTLRTLHWGNSDSYDADATDRDIPAETLTYSLVNNTCSFVPMIDGGTGLVNWTCNGMEDCGVDVRATDQCAGGALSSEETIYIECINTPPSFTSLAPTSITENTPYTYDAVCFDPDGDAMTLATSPSHTCPGAFVDNGGGLGQFTVTPDETTGGSNCVLGIICSDSQESVQQNTPLAIVEDNQPPLWNPPAPDIWAWTNESIDYHWGHADDSDIPAQTLTYSKTGQSCSFVVNVSGSGIAATDCDFSFMTSAGAEECDVSVQVSDGAGGVVSQTIPIHVLSGSCIFYTDPNAAGAETGMNWTDAFSTLQVAADRASTGCQVWAKNTTFATGDTNPVLIMKDGVEFYGGFVGTESTPANRNLLANSTLLDGEFMDKTVVLGASYARLDGFDIENSRSSDLGGGIYNLNVDSLVVDNCDFSNNWSYFGGGGAANLNSSITINNSTFSDNQAFFCDFLVGNGGGIYNAYSNSIVNNCDFDYNTAEFYGGGIFETGGTLTVNNSVFDSNEAKRVNGGAINTQNSTFVLSNSTISNNASNVAGAGVFNYIDSYAYIYDTDFTENYAIFSFSYPYVYYFIERVPIGGGGLGNKYSYARTERCTFDSNLGYYWGSGIGNMYTRGTFYSIGNDIVNNEGQGLMHYGDIAGSSSVLISDTVFSYNTNGGAWIAGASVNVDDCVFYKNSTSGSGLGVGYGGGLGGGLLDGAISNCIFDGNTANRGAAIGLFNCSGGLDIINNLIVNNVADNLCGGIFSRAFTGETSFVNIINTTLVDNNAGYAASAVFSWGDSVVNIGNSILWDVLSPEVDASSGGIINVGYSDLRMSASSVYAGAGNINVNPLFASPSNFHLSQPPDQASTSPCVDAGIGSVPAYLLNTTTSTSGAADTGTVDMGFHYPIP